MCRSPEGKEHPPPSAPSDEARSARGDQRSKGFLSLMRRTPASCRTQTSPPASIMSDDEGGRGQGLTLVHSSAQLKRLLCDRGCS